MDTLVWRISLCLFVLSEFWNVYWMWRFVTCLLYMLCWKWFVGHVWVVWIVLLCYANWNANWKSVPSRRRRALWLLLVLSLQAKAMFLELPRCTESWISPFPWGKSSDLTVCVCIYIIFTVHQYVYLYAIICNIFLYVYSVLYTYMQVFHYLPFYVS